MLFNRASSGFLVFDMSDRITSNDEAYACTTSDKDQGPIARSVLVIRKAEQSKPGDVIKYGEKVVFESNPYISNKTIYLHST